MLLFVQPEIADDSHETDVGVLWNIVFYIFRTRSSYLPYFNKHALT